MEKFLKRLPSSLLDSNHVAYKSGIEEIFTSSLCFDPNKRATLEEIGNMIMELKINVNPVLEQLMTRVENIEKTQEYQGRLLSSLLSNRNHFPTLFLVVPVRAYPNSQLHDMLGIDSSKSLQATAPTYKGKKRDFFGIDQIDIAKEIFSSIIENFSPLTFFGVQEQFKIYFVCEYSCNLVDSGIVLKNPAEWYTKCLPLINFSLIAAKLFANISGVPVGGVVDVIRDQLNVIGEPLDPFVNAVAQASLFSHRNIHWKFLMSDNSTIHTLIACIDEVLKHESFDENMSQETQENLLCFYNCLKESLKILPTAFIHENELTIFIDIYYYFLECIDSDNITTTFSLDIAEKLSPLKVENIYGTKYSKFIDLLLQNYFTTAPAALTVIDECLLQLRLGCIHRNVKEYHSLKVCLKKLTIGDSIDLQANIIPPSNAHSDLEMKMIECLLEINASLLQGHIECTSSKDKGDVESLRKDQLIFHLDLLHNLLNNAKIGEAFNPKILNILSSISRLFIDFNLPTRSDNQLSSSIERSNLLINLEMTTIDTFTATLSCLVSVYYEIMLSIHTRWRVDVFPVVYRNVISTWNMGKGALESGRFTTSQNIFSLAQYFQEMASTMLTICQFQSQFQEGKTKTLDSFIRTLRSDIFPYLINKLQVICKLPANSRHPSIMEIYKSMGICCVLLEEFDHYIIQQLREDFGIQISLADCKAYKYKSDQQPEFMQYIRLTGSATISSATKLLSRVSTDVKKKVFKPKSNRISSFSRVDIIHLLLEFWNSLNDYKTSIEIESGIQKLVKPIEIQNKTKIGNDKALTEPDQIEDTNGKMVLMTRQEIMDEFANVLKQYGDYLTGHSERFFTALTKTEPQWKDNLTVKYVKSEKSDAWVNVKMEHKWRRAQENKRLPYKLSGNKAVTFKRMNMPQKNEGKGSDTESLIEDFGGDSDEDMENGQRLQIKSSCYDNDEIIFEIVDEMELQNSTVNEIMNPKDMEKNSPHSTINIKMKSEKNSVDSFSNMPVDKQQGSNPAHSRFLGFDYSFNGFLTNRKYKVTPTGPNDVTSI